MQSDSDSLEHILQARREGEYTLNIGNDSHICFYKEMRIGCVRRVISESVSERLHLKQWHQQGESQTTSLLSGCDYFGSSPKRLFLFL